MYPSIMGFNERYATFIEIQISEIVYGNFFEVNEWKKQCESWYKYQQYSLSFPFWETGKINPIQVKWVSLKTATK